ncbi:hypothetical protein DPMN_049525 [Dreissena polymorpha]|uniref:Uncharacterized protein n=1 Tax=Dreissena polymorpha TaxID=45954 RepID=A0A9D4HM75_DREPO|nr:hypothetical protein DPMN_049462 [Dreissena polymorpha]KAH3723731.1 hypothetical protein DPMN_049525 [Dreissena polymorpha]
MGFRAMREENGFKGHEGRKWVSGPLGKKMGFRSMREENGFQGHEGRKWVSGP